VKRCGLKMREKGDCVVHACLKGVEELVACQGNFWRPVQVSLLFRL
jgi:hypothetical protein